MIDTTVYDLTIVGAGPTGLFSAFYAGLRGMRTKIIESLPEAGGQLAVLYPEKLIYDVPGFPKILAKDLVPLLIEQTRNFEPSFVYEASIAAVRHAGIEMRTFWEIKRVFGKNGVVDGATIYNNKTGEEEEIDVDIVLLSLGFKASLGPIEGWGMTLADQRHVAVDGFMQTNLPGVFA